MNSTLIQIDLDCWLSHNMDINSETRLIDIRHKVDGKDYILCGIVPSHTAESREIMRCNTLSDYFYLEPPKTLGGLLWRKHNLKINIKLVFEPLKEVAECT